MSCSILEIGIYSEIHKSFLTRHVFRDTFEQDLDAVQNWSLALKGKYITAYLLQSTDIVSVLSETKQATVWVDPEDYLDKKNDKFILVQMVGFLMAFRDIAVLGVLSP